MKLYRSLGVLLIVSFLLGACGANGGGGPSLFPTATPSPGLPTPHMGLTPAPDERAAVSAYFDALKVNDLGGMYALLTKLSQETITQENFAKRYNDALNEMGTGKFDYEILSSLLSPYTAQVNVRLTYHTALVGDIQRDILMNLAIDSGQWRVQWEDRLILPELSAAHPELILLASVFHHYKG